MGDQPKVVHKSSKSVFDTHTESKESKKVLFCKKYQSDKCHVDLKNNAHWGNLGGKSHLLHQVCSTCLLKCKKSEHHHEKISECPLFAKAWLVETNLWPLQFPPIVYSDALSSLLDQDNVFIASHLVLPAQVVDTLQHASSLDEISQYYVLPDKPDQL